MIEYLEFDSPLGVLRIAAVPGGICGVYLDAQKHYPSCTDWREASGNPDLDAAKAQLAEYFARQRREFQLRLAPSGTPFQHRVWEALREIPFGATTSYSAIAGRLGAPNSTRAVAAAVGRNPIGIIVPCHRVLGKDGSLTGFAGGLARKEALLQLEGALMPAGPRA